MINFKGAKDTRGRLKHTLLNFDNVTKDKDKIIIITLIIINGIIKYIIPFQEGCYIGKFMTVFFMSTSEVYDIMNIFS